MTGNGNDKWQIGFWVLTVLVVSSFTWATACAWMNQTKIENNRIRYDNLKEVANDALHKIDLRLSRIEDKLDIAS